MATVKRHTHTRSADVEAFRKTVERLTINCNKIVKPDAKFFKVLKKKREPHSPRNQGVENSPFAMRQSLQELSTESPSLSLHKKSGSVIPFRIKERSGTPKRNLLPEFSRLPPSLKKELISMEISSINTTTTSKNSEKPVIFIKRSRKIASETQKRDANSNSPEIQVVIYFKFNHPDPIEGTRPFEYWKESTKILRELHSDRFVNEPAIPQAPVIDYRRKPVLVIDLDETLVHCCNFDGPNATFETSISYKSMASEKDVVAHLNLRPHAHWFLKKISEHYQVVAYTASDMDYAVAVCRLLDPFCNLFAKILSRRSCIRTKKGYLVKDLRLLAGEDTSRIVLVDNSVHCFAPQINNGIPILPYFTGDSDNELKKLFQFLLELKNQNNIPLFLKKFFGLSQLIKCTTDQDILRHFETIGSKY